MILMPLSRTLSLLFIAGALAFLTTAVGAGLLTSSTSVPENTFTNGTLILGVNPTSTLVTFANMAPGDQVTQPLAVTNHGTLELRYAITSNSTNEDTKDLAAVMQLQIKADVTDCTNMGLGSSGSALYSGTVNAASVGDPTQGPQPGDRTLAAGASEVLCFNASLPLTTTNAYTQATTTTTFNFLAEQTANNGDAPETPIGSLAAGAVTNCYLRTDGTTECWGGNTYGQATAPSTTFTKIGAAAYSFCGIQADGSLQCWGSSLANQLTPPPGSYAALDGGYNAWCGLKADGSIVCWGDNTYGQANVPAGTYQAMAMSDYSACAIQSDDTARCWGRNAGYGELNPPAGTYQKISGDGFTFCGIKTDNTLACWGLNNYGQATPPTGSYVAVANTANHACALAADGTIKCWGATDEVGLVYPPSGRYLDLAMSNNHACAVRTDGKVLCWGSTSNGLTSVPADIAGTYQQAAIPTPTPAGSTPVPIGPGNGSLDAYFNIAWGGAPTAVSRVLEAPDGKLYIFGTFSWINGVRRVNLARLWPDGTLDTTFSAPSDVNYVYALALQSDGKLLIGGSFTTLGGVSRKYLARLNSDGSLDSTYVPPTFDNNVQTLYMTDGDKVLISGNFTKINGAYLYLARLNPDGTVDSTWNTGATGGTNVRAIAKQTDGKYVLGGRFTTYNGISRYYMARLNADGTLDTGWASTTFANMPNNYVNAVAIAPDGQIYIGGDFNTSSGFRRGYIARLSAATGAVDTNFPNQTSSVAALAVQADGKVLMAGGNATRKISRLNLDGSFDASFITTVSNAPYGLALTSGYRFYLWGNFTTVNSAAVKFLTRLK